jgi:hypothetical protein
MLCHLITLEPLYLIVIKFYVGGPCLSALLVTRYLKVSIKT